MVITSSWADHLTESDREFVLSDHRRGRMMAGPGAGKTRAMMHRVRYLLEQRTPPEKILAVTFTRTAAQNLRDKLQEVEAPGSDEIQACTLHSFAYALLSRWGRTENNQLHPRPLLDFERSIAIHDLKVSRTRSVHDCKKLLRELEASWANDQQTEPSPLGPGYRDPVRQSFHNDVMNWLREHQAMLLDQLIAEALTMLRTDLGAGVSIDFDHVIVDEYQDLNKAEQVLIDLISATATLTIIGDPNQSIYSFRHARPEAMDDFPLRHAECRNFAREICFRCPSKIVEIANELMSRSGDQQPTIMKPGNPTEGSVEIIQASSLAVEVREIASRIAVHVNRDGVTLKDILVLTPRSAQGHELQKALTGHGIASHSYFEDTTFADPVAKRNFALLTLVARSSDRVALRTWLGTQPNSTQYHCEKYERLREASARAGLSTFEWLESHSKKDQIPRKYQWLIGNFRQLQSELHQLSGFSPTELVDRLFPDDDERTADLRQLSLKALGEVDEDADVAEFYRALSEWITRPENAVVSDHVRIMSLLRSKGLDAKIVVVMGCIDAWIPGQSEGNDRDIQLRVEEMRRLMYVAITRATERLILSSFERMPNDVMHRTKTAQAPIIGGRRRYSPSRFIAEFGNALPPITRVS